MLSGLLAAFLRNQRSTRSGSDGMGQCGSTLAPAPGCQLRKDTSASGSGADERAPKLFSLDVDASSKTAEALAAAIAAGQPDSPAICAVPSSQSEERELGLRAAAAAKAAAGADAAAEELQEPSSARAASATRARRLSLPGTEGPPSTSSSSGSLAGSRAGSEEEAPAALSAQPGLPEAHPLPVRRVTFDYSPVKTHRYETPEEEEEEGSAAGGERAAGGRGAPPALLVPALPLGPASNAGSTPGGSPSKSALAAELLLRQQRGPASPSRAAALAGVAMRDLLHSVASLSRAGKEPTYRKTNQDSCFAYSQYCRPNQALLAALDGHGPHGHAVSSFLKRQLPLVLADQLGESRPKGCACGPASANASFTSTASSTACSSTGSAAGSACGRHCCEAAAAAAVGWTDPAGALRATFLSVDESLNSADSGINVQYSGSTAVVCMLRGRRLTTAWVGDSKAVLARQEPRGLRAIPLTRDHKPNTPDERARIAACGGRVERLVDGRGLPVGPDRVWLSTSWVPGLAMSRALGDAVAHSVGVSSEPESSVVELCPQDKFLILATDGVWEFIDPQGAVDVVANCQDAEEACRVLVDTAWGKWVIEEDGVVDDITVVVAKLCP